MGEQSASEKTEQPTQKKIRDAKKRGQVARSTDVVTTIVTAGVLFVLLVTFGGMSERMEAFMQKCLFAISYHNPNAMAEVSNQALVVIAYLIIPISLAAIISVFFGNVLQFGFLLASESLKPSMDKLNPMNGLKRMFSMKSLLEFVKGLIKLLLLISVVTFVISNSIAAALMIPYGGIEALYMVGEAMFKNFLIAIILAYIVISIIDFLLQRMLLTKDLMMTKDEVKRENKDSEGDPQIKGSRKQLARELIFEDAPTGAKKSTVLVTNPTHYSIGIYFEKGVTPLPKLRAKGIGFVALKMREAARDAQVPIVENVPLARQMYEQLEVNDFITGDLLEPVAEILRWVATLPKRPA